MLLLKKKDIKSFQFLQSIEYLNLLFPSGILVKVT